MKVLPKRRPRRLDLGIHYIVKFQWGNTMLCKFIQPTKCGFNFLNIKTNKCILRQHLYPSKCENHIGEDWFFVNETFEIKKIKLC
ncbi:MAG: hypothetical protein ACJAVA_000214 [Flavobacteriaceae bacterium]|jgi:hypothetical protein